MLHRTAAVGDVSRSEPISEMLADRYVDRSPFAEGRESMRLKGESALSAAHLPRGLCLCNRQTDRQTAVSKWCRAVSTACQMLFIRITMTQSGPLCRSVVVNRVDGARPTVQYHRHHRHYHVL